jgi:regulator of sigma E protease
VFTGWSVLQVLAAILGVGFLIAFHELGHYWVARKTGMRVLRYSIGFGPALWHKVVNDIEYRIAILPLGGFVHIFGMSPLEEGAREDPKSFINRPYWAKMAVIFAGPLFNYALAVVLFFCVFWIFSTGNSLMLKVSDVMPESAAAQAGLVADDVIVGLNGSGLTSTEDFLGAVAQATSTPLALRVARKKEGQKDPDMVEVSLLPKPDSTGTLRMGIRYTPLGFSFSGAVKESFYQPWKQSVGTLQALSSKLFGQGKDVQVGGIVEVTRQLTVAAEKGYRSLLWMLGSLSVVLGLFNLLPIPSLDGSRMLFLTIERVMGRELNPTFQIWVNVIGLVFLLGLMAILTVFDVMRLMG